MFTLLLLAHLAQAGTDADAVSCQRKIDEIKADRAKPASVYLFTPREINAWARKEIQKEIPQGVREPSVQFGLNQGTGFAYVDFLKMQHAKGVQVGWLMEKLISGERPIRISVELKSNKGFATAYLRRVEISGVSASGSLLDYLIRTYFRPLYPEAHIDESFEMGHNVDRVEVRPDGARVFIKGVQVPTRPVK